MDRPIDPERRRRRRIKRAGLALAMLGVTGQPIIEPGGIDESYLIWEYPALRTIRPMFEKGTRPLGVENCIS